MCYRRSAEILKSGIEKRALYFVLCSLSFGLEKFLPKHQGQSTKHKAQKLQAETPSTKYKVRYNDALIASSNISRATSTFSFVSINGGDQRMELLPAPRMIKPLSKHAISIRSRKAGAGFRDVRSSTNSTPIMSPM